MKDMNEIQGNLVGGEWLLDGDCRPSCQTGSAGRLQALYECGTRFQERCDVPRYPGLV